MKSNGLLARMRKSYRESPTFLLVSWFTILIVTGSILLYIPASQVDGTAPVDFVSALFTATSAACVTGLTVVDTPEAFSLFGQFVILVLMELGGIGVVAFANLGFVLVGRRLSFSERLALTDSLFQSDAAREFGNTFKRVIRVVGIVQLAGVILMAVSLVPWHMHDGRGVFFALWSALFHTVSSFCNAGFSIYRGNLESAAGNLPFMAIVMAMIVLGGLGHVVLAELWRLPSLYRRRKGPRLITLNTRVVLIVTPVLLVGGTLALWLTGLGPVDSIGHALFQSVSSRTAGFNSLPLNKLSAAACLFLCLLMFIGGSPGSCAGGVKTTSIAIWLARIKSNLRNDPNVNIFGYTIAPELVSRARILMTLSVLWNIVGVVLLSLTQSGASLDSILFEQVSAFATVGLSMGLTPELTDVSRLWIILSMYVGRLGPLTVILWVIPLSRVDIRRPIGRVMVG